jgi:hypothetical protein
VIQAWLKKWLRRPTGRQAVTVREVLWIKRGCFGVSALQAAASCVALLTIAPRANADPIMDVSGYKISLFGSGGGAVDGLAFDPTGDLYATDYSGGRVLRVAAPFAAGVNSFQVVAGGIPFPTDLAFDASGRPFVTSSTGSSSNVVQVFPTGQTSVFATGLSFPTSIGVYGSNLYVTASGDGTIERIDSSGRVHAFLSGFGGPNGPYGISFKPSGEFYFAVHQSGDVYEGDLNGATQLLANVGSSLGAIFTAVAPNGDLFVSDVATGTILVQTSGGGFSAFASGFLAKVNPPFIGPTDMAFDASGDMFVGDGGNIWEIQPLAAVPEPSSLLLLGYAGAIIAFRAGSHALSRRRACGHAACSFKLLP